MCYFVPKGSGFGGSGGFDEAQLRPRSARMIAPGRAEAALADPIAARALVVDVLRRAERVLRDPRRWTTGVYARDASGTWVGGGSPSATCWCLDGALRKAVREVLVPARWTIYCPSERLLELARGQIERTRTASHVLARARRAAVGLLVVAVPVLNDSASHEEVHACLVEALEALRP
jgi:hypothetical protein